MLFLIVFSPGSIRTNFLEHIVSTKSQVTAIMDQYGHQCPVGRAGEPQDIANIVMYLVSDNSSFITGTDIVVDGGFTRANRGLK